MRLGHRESSRSHHILSHHSCRCGAIEPRSACIPVLRAYTGRTTAFLSVAIAEDMEMRKSCPACAVFRFLFQHMRALSAKILRKSTSRKHLLNCFIE